MKLSSLSLFGLTLLLGWAAVCFSAGTDTTLTDKAFLENEIWNDGQAEVAFYQVVRERDQYGKDQHQEFLVGTYLVKHDYDPATESKAKPSAKSAVSAFKFAFFYEIESRSYQYKRNFVVNAAQADLAPLKQSFSSFDWCSNRYSELVFVPGGKVKSLARSDDYGNANQSFNYRPNAFPIEELPLLVRGLDFSGNPQQRFLVVLGDGTYVAVRARLEADETLVIGDQNYAAQRIAVEYDKPVPSMIAEISDTLEFYWRGTDPARLLLKIEGQSKQYHLILVEQLRSPYWSENLYTRLLKVQTRP